MKNTSGQTLYGADILTIINKAIDNNEENKIQKNEEGLYIENDENSVKVEITLLSLNEKNEQIEVVRQMESLEKAGLNQFISAFGITKFECTDIQYNANKRVSKIKVKQLEL